MAEEGVQDAAVITCTILIQSASSLVLFNPSSMHTLLAKTFVDKTDMRLDGLGYDLILSKPEGAVLATRV